MFPISSSTGAVLSFLIHIIIGAFFAITVYFLRLYKSTKSVGIGIMWVLRWLPPFALADSINNSSGF